MGITVPKNIILTGKYTLEGEYVLLSSQAPYQGYYYELNGKTFAGKEFNSEAPEIVKITSGKIPNNPEIAAYNKISKLKINTTKIESIPFAPTVDDLSEPFIVRYFAKPSNNTFIIKEITKDTFNEIQSNPLYQTLKVDFNYNLPDEELNRLDKIMPGIKLYLTSEEPNTSNNDVV